MKINIFGRKIACFGGGVVMGLGLLLGPLLCLADEQYYRAKVPVISQTSSERKQAVSIGLEKVLFRLTGYKLASQNPVVQAALSKPEAYMEQFRYADLPDMLGERPLSEREAAALLVVDFSPQLIDKLLQSSGIPFWPLNRPEVLVWLVEDSAEFGRSLVNDPELPAYQSLEKAAAERGLPIRLPLLDLEDQLALPADRVWMMDEESILEASKRYSADTVLVGRFSQTSLGEWLASWQYFHREESDAFDERSHDPLILGQDAIGGLADFLVERYAVARSEDTLPIVSMELGGVADFKAYTSVIKYLDELAVISSYEILEIRNDALLIEAKVIGGAEQLNGALSLDARLKPLANSFSEDVPAWMKEAYSNVPSVKQYEWQN